VRSIRLAALVLLLATPAFAQTDGREQAMANFWIKVCLDNNNSYDAVAALAKSSGWDAMDPSAVPFPLWQNRAEPGIPLAWKVEGFILTIAPKSPTPGPGGHRVVDACSLQGFDLDLDKTVAQLRADHRLTYIASDNRGVLFSGPGALPIPVWRWPNAKGSKKGQFALLINAAF
jgi:hypothetical protein